MNRPFDDKFGGVNPQLFQFTEDAAISPDRLSSYPRSPHLPGLLAVGFFTDPGSVVDDRDEVRSPRPYKSGEVQPALLVRIYRCLASRANY